MSDFLCVQIPNVLRNGAVTLPVVNGLQNGLCNIFNGFLAALRNKRKGRFSAGSFGKPFHDSNSVALSKPRDQLPGCLVCKALTEKFLEGGRHVADLLRSDGQRPAAQAVAQLLAVGGPGLAGLLCRAAHAPHKHGGQCTAAGQSAQGHVPAHLHTGHAHVHGKLARLAQALLGLGNVLGRAFRQLVRLPVSLVRHGLVALFHSLGIAPVCVDLPLVGGDIGLDLLPVRRRQGLAVRPLAVPEHGGVVLDGLNGSHLFPGGIVVGDHSVQLPGTLCQNAAGIHIPGSGGLRRAGHNVLDAAGRVVFGAGGVCHKSLLLPGVRGAFSPPAGGHPLILAGGFLRCGGLGNRRFPFPISH